MIPPALKAVPLLLGKAFHISVHVLNLWKRLQQVVSLAIIQLSAKDMAKPNTDLACMEALLQPLQPFLIYIYIHVYIYIH